MSPRTPDACRSCGRTGGLTEPLYDRAGGITGRLHVGLCPGEPEAAFWETVWMVLAARAGQATSGVSGGLLLSSAPTLAPGATRERAPESK